MDFTEIIAKLNSSKKNWSIDELNNLRELSGYLESLVSSSNEELLSHYEKIIWAYYRYSSDYDIAEYVKTYAPLKMSWITYVTGNVSPDVHLPPFPVGNLGSPTTPPVND